MSFEHEPSSHDSNRNDFDPQIVEFLDYVDRSLAPPADEMISEVDAVFGQDVAEFDDLTLTPDARMAKLLLEREARVTLDALLEILSESLPEKPTLQPISRLDPDIKPRAEQYMQAWKEKRRSRIREEGGNSPDTDNPQ